jgi:hypothetical protein
MGTSWSLGRIEVGNTTVQVSVLDDVTRWRG